MLRIRAIYEQKDILSYLETRNLLEQYRRAKQFLLRGNLMQVRFKKRRPKGSGIWYFRINQQYRALCVFNVNKELIVFAIDDHQ